MRAPPGAFRLSSLPAGSACFALLLVATALPAETAGGARQAMRANLPRYDPAIREAHLAAQAAAAEAPRPVPKPPAPVAPPAPDGDTLVLDPITVWAKPDAKLPTPLPRLTFFSPVRDLPGKPLESPSARDARLIRKHLGALDQFLNKITLPFIGQPLAARARQAEAELQRAQQLNGIADAIDTGILIGQDPELIKKLRQEYLRLYYAGPK